jgi:hypothetical protein
MKIITDFSVTSARVGIPGVVGRWDAAWQSPLSLTAPGLVLDFAAQKYGSGGTEQTLAGLVTLTRASDATRTDAAGLIQTLGPDQHRLTHDPLSLALLGILLEEASENLLVDSDIPIDQSVTLTAVEHAISFYGAGTVTLSGAFSAVIPGTGAYPARTTLAFTPTAGVLNVVISGDVTAIQLEIGAFETSYIPSGAMSTIRDAGVASVGIGSWFQATQGTIVFSGHIDGAMANDRIFEIDAGVTSTRLSLLWNTVLSKPQFQVWDGGVLHAAIAPAGNAIPFGTPFRVALAYDANDFAVSMDGASAATDSTGVVPTGLTTLRLGRSIGGAQGQMTLESLTYYPARLSNAELSALSA